MSHWMFPYPFSMFLVPAEWLEDGEMHDMMILCHFSHTYTSYHSIYGKRSSPVFISIASALSESWRDQSWDYGICKEEQEKAGMKRNKKLKLLLLFHMHTSSEGEGHFHPFVLPYSSLPTLMVLSSAWILRPQEWCFWVLGGGAATMEGDKGKLHVPFAHRWEDTAEEEEFDTNWWQLHVHCDSYFWVMTSHSCVLPLLWNLNVQLSLCSLLFQLHFRFPEHMILVQMILFHTRFNLCVFLKWIWTAYERRPALAGMYVCF